MSGERLLVIEDDKKIADLLFRGLAYEGYTVSVADNGERGLAAARDAVPDLIILDWMLPGMDGLEVLRRIRTVDETPVLMLTAKESVQNRVEGLETGADDYLVKPFAFEELLARVRVLLRRRAQEQDEEVLRYEGLELNLLTRQAWRNERPIELTAKEFDLLEYFMRHPRQVLTREQIYDRVWGYDFGGESNIIEVYVRYLRSKLEAEGEVRLLQTIRGVGYTLRIE